MLADTTTYQLLFLLKNVKFSATQNLVKDQIGSLKCTTYLKLEKKKKTKVSQWEVKHSGIGV